MTNLEFQALILANELELVIKSGGARSMTGVVLALNKLRQVQIESNVAFNHPFPDTEVGLCPVIQLHERRKYKVIKKP